MKLSECSKTVCLCLMAVLSTSSCYNVPSHSYGYRVDESQQLYAIMAYRRSEINHRSSYSEDEDIPLIFAYGFPFSDNDYIENIYSRKFSCVDKIVFYFTNKPYEGALTFGDEYSPEFINSIYGNGNEQYKHLEEYGYYYFLEFDPEDFYTQDYIVTTNHYIRNYTHEEEMFIPRDALNVLGLTDGVGIMRVLYRNDNYYEEYGPYCSEGYSITVEFSEL